PRYVVFLARLAHVTLLSTTILSTTELWVRGGKHGLILAVDTAVVLELEHVTKYPSNADTVKLQSPPND
ncbi:hypothetical protein EJ08DRAFT_622324, partial [Tothia fuscella]